MPSLSMLLIVTSNLLLTVTQSLWLAPEVHVLWRHRKEGDIIIGGVFTNHVGLYGADSLESSDSPCGRFDMYTYRMSQTIMFVLDNTNRNPLILPNITLGFEIYDSCAIISRCIQSTFWFLSGRNKPVPGYNCHKTSVPAVMIAEWLSGNSAAVAHLLGIYRFPQISYATEDVSLSDHYLFPSFLRTIPSSVNVLDGVVQLLIHFKWKMVGMLVPVDYAGEETILLLKNKIISAGICISVFEKLFGDRQYFKNTAKSIRLAAPKVLISCNAPGLKDVIDNLVMLNVTGITWIGIDWWPQSGAYILGTGYHPILEGTLWFSMALKNLPGFQNFQFSIHPFKDTNDIFIRMFWETIFECTWNIQNESWAISNSEIIPCTGMEDINQINNDKFFFFGDFQSLLGYATYNAASAAVQALHKMQACRHGTGPFLNGSCAQFPHFLGWQLFHYLRNIHFTTEVNEEIFFNDDGYVPAMYWIRNFQVMKNGVISGPTVGIYDPKLPTNMSLFMINAKIIWNGGKKQPPRSVCSESCLPGFIKVIQRGKPACCFDCVPCAEGEIANCSDSTDCLACAPKEWSNERRDKCIPRYIDFLSYSDVLGSALVVIAVTNSLLVTAIFFVFVKFSHTPLVRANNRNISYILLVALLLCFLCSLLFIGQPNKMTCKLRQVVFGIIFVLSVSCVLAKTIMVVVAFNATKPDSYFKRWVGPQLSYAVIFLCTLVQIIICINWIIFASPFPEWNFISQPGYIIIECNEGSTVAFWCMLGYMGFLAGTSFIVAFLSRNLPDSFNEAKFITFSMVVFVSVWLAFIPAYLSTKGKYMVAVEIFAIISSSLGLLVCIFFPKCYIIILRPDINTKEYLRSKGNKE